MTTADDRSIDEIIDTAYVVCGSGRRQVGFAYRVWSSGTSFYLKPLVRGCEGVKISLHGPDPRPGLTPMFKATVSDGGRTFADDNDGVRAIGYRVGDWPVLFEGRPLAGGGRLVARIRWTWDSCFRPRMSSLGGLKTPKKNQLGAIATAPTQAGYAADLDLVYSNDRPRWQYHDATERDNAWIGPFQNKSGHFLTGAVIHRSLLKYPNPPASNRHSPTADDEVRGLFAGMDLDGVFWFLQQRQSSTQLRLGMITDEAPEPEQ